MIRGTKVLCWGAGSKGQLGSLASTIAGSGLPRVVPWEGAAPAAIVAGFGHTCVLDEAGAIWCWGMNGSRQCGGKGRYVLRPRRVAIARATAIAAGSASTCALVSGRVLCWGSNSYGQVKGGPDLTAGGHGYRETRYPEPQVIPGIEDAVALWAGRSGACARKRSGAVWCWGRFFKAGHADLPSGGRARAAKAPVAITELSGAIGVTFGRFLCGHLPPRRLRCDFGTVLARPAFKDVKARVAALGAHGDCVILNNGDVACLDGKGALARTKMPAPAVELASSAHRPFYEAAAHRCARDQRGAIRCWGANHQGQLGVAPSEAKSVKDVRPLRLPK